MNIGNGKDTGDANDFNLMGDVNCARLCRYLGAHELGAAPLPGGFPNEAVARVARFILAHQRDWPVTVNNCHWRSLAGLLTHVRNAGPECSEDDVAAAIQILPAMGTVAWLDKVH